MTSSHEAFDPAFTPSQIEQDWEVRDGGRFIRFTGRMLARTTSERPRAPRWTVMELYRTQRGMYVVHRIGMTKVFHTSDCSLARMNHLPYGHEDPNGPPTSASLGNLSPCVDCMPEVTDPTETLRFERERHWAGIADTSHAAVDIMHRTNGNKKTLPWLAASLLELAAQLDPDIRDAYSNTVVTII